MQIKYGILSNNIDVTKICYDKLLKNDIITIPHGEFKRAAYFTDPLERVLKIIIIIDEDNNITEYDYTLEIQINIISKEITVVTAEKAEATKGKMKK